MVSLQYPPPPPPNVVSKLRSRFLLPAIAVAAIAALLLVSFDTGPAKAQSTPAVDALHLRTPQVCEALLARLRTDTDTSAIYNATNGTYPWSDSGRATLLTGATAPTSGTYTQPVNLGCTGTGNTVHAGTTQLTSLNFYYWPNRLDLHNKNLDSLAATDFAGLATLVYVDLAYNNLTTLPGNLFGDTRLGWVALNNNKISSLPANAFARAGAATQATVGGGTEWNWGPTHGGLLLDNNPIRTFPDTIFDGWTDMRSLSLRNTGITTFNTRWIERLANLGMSTFGRQEATIRFGGLPLARWHRKVGSAVTANSENEYFGDAAPFATALKAAITAYASATAGVTDNAVITLGTTAEVNDRDAATPNFEAPGIGIDICGDRSPAAEGEILSALGAVPDDGLGRGWESRVGDIDFARFEKLTCVGQPADWRTIETGELFTGAYSASTHTGASATVAKSFKDIGWHVMFLEAADVLDSDGALKPADFENLFHVNQLWIYDIKVKDIPADTFKHMPNLWGLRIQNGLIDEDDLTGANSFLQHFKGLQTLWITGNNLSEFDASTHLPANVRATLKTLHINGNPIKETDLDGLDLTALRIQDTRITTLDPALRDMDNLEQLWWRNDFLTNEGIGDSDPEGFFADFPATLEASRHANALGNPFHSDDPVIQAAGVQTQLAHAARIKALNDADPGNDLVKTHFLGDPCRPSLWDFENVEDWSDSGDLCLTSSQIGDWASTIDGFNGLQALLTYNVDLSDGQAGTLIDAIDSKPMSELRIDGAEDAFGAGFDDSKLDAFESLSGLAVMLIRGTQMTLDQSKTILRGLESSHGTAASHGGLFYLDFGFTPHLFAGANANSVQNYLRGVTITQENQWSDLHLYLRQTGLTFPVLKGIIDSMDDELLLRALDVANNPNLWTDADGDPVANSEITALFTQLKGTSFLNVSQTGMTAAQARAMFTALGTVGSGAEVGTDGGLGVAQVKHPLARMEEIGISGIDLSTGIDLNADVFAKFAGRFDESVGTLHRVKLSDSNMDFGDLGSVVVGLETAGLEDQIRRLTLDKSDEIWDDPAATATAVTTLFTKFTNLRVLSVRDSGLTLDNLKAILAGLDAADGSPTPNDGANNMYVIDVRNNEDLFAPIAADPTATPPVLAETPAQHAARLAPVFATASHAIFKISGTGLAQNQLNAIIAANADLREQLREGGAVDMTSTPPPKSAAAESGRRSLKIVFTHEPRALTAEGATITQTGYQYRYRALPADPTEEWTQRWRTLTLDLALGTADSKSFSFNLHGLNPEAAYQIQLRASGGTGPGGMTAASGTVMLRGGTILDLPQINSISPEVTEVSLRAGDTVRLAVNIFGLADNADNGIVDQADSDLIFRWSETSTITGGSFADPNHERRVIYTAPGLPGTYTVMAEAQPDGICRKHHTSDFGITDAERAECQATFTIRVARAADVAEVPPDPINPGGLPPTSLTDRAGTAYAVFLPVEGGTFTGEGITVSAQPGAVPDLTFVGVAATTAGAVPAPTPGARMTLAGSFFDIDGVTQNGAAPVTGYIFDDPISACVPLPAAFRGNVSDVVLVEQKSDGSLGVLATKIRQTSGSLSVCGSLTNLPATVAVAKLGTVPPPPPEPGPDTGDELPDTGATAPASTWLLWTLLLGATALLLATTAYTTRNRRNTRRTN